MLVVGSEVPNLLEPDAAATLVVSQDVDVAIPVQRHSVVKELLIGVAGLHPSIEEPSVWIPDAADLIEVNFIGVDATLTDATEVHVLEDSELPLLVFGALSILRPGPPGARGGPHDPGSAPRWPAGREVDYGSQR